MNIWNLIGSIVGGALGGSVLAKVVIDATKDRWIEKVKANYAEDLEMVKNLLQKEQKGLQARLDRSIFVSKAQFDTEFNAMKDIYRYATQVWIVFPHIRPMFETRPANQTEDERRDIVSEQLVMLIEAFNVFAKEMEILRPFYSDELYGALLECRKAAAREITQIRSAGGTMFDLKWYISGSENQEAFSDSYNQAASSIRRRLDQLSIIAY